MKIPRDIAQFIAVMGLELAPLVNLVFALILLIQVLQKKVINLPSWQTIFNLIMLMVQIAILFI
jgi:Mlc titration factor MtfA (ptsG expression regulator)